MGGIAVTKTNESQRTGFVKVVLTNEGRWTGPVQGSDLRCNAIVVYSSKTFCEVHAHQFIFRCVKVRFGLVNCSECQFINNKSLKLELQAFTHP